MIFFYRPQILNEINLPVVKSNEVPIQIKASFIKHFLHTKFSYTHIKIEPDELGIRGAEVETELLKLGNENYSIWFGN